ncbi:hypothetical protein EVAR_30718_1 [Eumeta japonica]|uniref:DUF5641 domain-containing protein n=1 Tax=Eumeta variegata TaxID=151549 RepID=A0A4C1V6V7_EUMVA|nr:hypothetical protein EVAR_30718_1 [Eumeta japonica]
MEGRVPTYSSNSSKWLKTGKPIQKGTVVVLKSDNSAPLDWPLGVIDDVHPGKDGVHKPAVVLETTVAAESEDITQKDQKLMVTFLEFKASKEMCDCFISERDDHQTEIISAMFMHIKLKRELAEMDIKCNHDLSHQHDRLQLLVSEMDDWRNQYEHHYVRYKLFRKSCIVVEKGRTN